MTTKSPTITSIALDDIEPIEGLNPRKSITEESVAELAESISRYGVLMPVLVGEQNGHEKWPLIAGARRLRAARKAGLKEIPVFVRDDLEGTELAAAISENAQRVDLDPIEEALALKRLQDEQGLKQIDAAKALGKSERWARERLRLLRLPPHTQTIFAARRIPIEAAVQLERVAKASPDLADLVAVKAKHGAIDAGSLTEQHGLADAVEQVLEEASDALVVKVAGANSYGASYRPADLPVAADVANELKLAYEEIPKTGYYTGGPTSRDAITFDDKDAEAAKKAGCLLELDSDYYGSRVKRRYITDPDFIAQRVREKLPKMKKAAQRKLRENEKRQAERAERQSEAFPAGAAAEELQQRKAEEEARQKVLATANAELGEKLQSLTLSGISMDVVRLVCSMALGNEEILSELIDCGLAKCDPGYVDPDADTTIEHADHVLTALVEAKTPEEAIAIVLRVAIASHFADLGESDPSWAGYGLQGPEMHRELLVSKQVEHVAHQLDVLPSAMVEWAKEQSRARADRQKADDERAAEMLDQRERKVLVLVAPKAIAREQLLTHLEWLDDSAITEVLDRLSEAKQIEIKKNEDEDADEIVEITDVGQARLDETKEQ